MLLKLLLLCLFLHLSTCHTANAWQVTAISGDAFLITTSQEQKLAVGSQIQENQAVQTGPDSEVQLANSGTNIYLSSKSRIMASRGIDFIYGKLRAQISQNDAKSFSLKTPTTVSHFSTDTEISLSVDTQTESISALKGNIETQIPSLKQSVSVPAGQTLIVDNRNRAQLVLNNSGGALRALEYDWEPNITGGMLGQLSYRYQNTLSQKYGSTQTRLEPFLRWQKSKLGVYLSPLVYFHNSTRTISVDNYPLHSSYQRAGTNLGQFFAEYRLEAGLSMQLGLSRFKWFEGYLVSDSNWRVDQLSHFSLNMKSLFYSGWKTEILVTEPGLLRLANQTLSGVSHIKMYGAQFSLPGNWLSLGLLLRDFGKPNPTRSALLQNKQTFDLFSYSKVALGKLGWRIYADYQALHDNHHTGTKQNFSATTTDIELQLKHKRLTLLPRWTLSSPRFTTGEESSFNLSSSGLISREDLESLHAKALYALNANWEVGAEQIHATQTSKKLKLKETTLLLTWKPDSYTLLYATVYSANPKNGYANGIATRLAFSF